MKRTPLKRKSTLKAKTPLKSYTKLKTYKRLTAKTPLRKVSKKQSTIERQRYSVFTTDLKHCIENKDHKGHIDKHEVFEGKNRLKSIKYGLVIPLCRTCHEDKEIIEKWQVIAKKEFIQRYDEELFIKEFQTKKGTKKELDN